MSNQTLAWGLIISVSLHLLALLYWPNHAATMHNEMPDILSIELLQPQMPEPVVTPAEPVPVPQPPKPQVPPRVKPQPAPKPAVKPQVTPTPQPTPVETPTIYESPVTLSEPSTETAPPVVQEPQPASPPVAMPSPPPISNFSQADLDDARRRYADQLARAIAKHRQYPRIAQMRGWQGETLIDLKLDNKGNVLVSRIERSSGFDALDKQALEMVKKAAPFPAPPDVLKNSQFNIQVPVSFKLE